MSVSPSAITSTTSASSSSSSTSRFDSAASSVQNAYHGLVYAFESSGIRPVVLKYGGAQLAVVFRHSASEEETSAAFNSACAQWNCRECGRRARYFSQFSTISGQIFFNEKFMNTDEMKTALATDSCYSLMQMAAATIAAKPIISLQVIRGSSVRDYPLASPSNVYYKHWTITIEENDRTDKTLEDKQIQMVEDALNRYLPAHLPSLIEKLVGAGSSTTENLNRVRDSLLMMKQCLDKAAYGYHFKPALEWLENIIHDLSAVGKPFAFLTPRERWTFCARQLVRTPITRDLHSAVCPFYHTANNNIIDLLHTANGVDEMVKLIEERLAPQNYQRRDVTANISDGEIKIAMKHLGEFSNSIMTLAQAAKLPTTVMINSKHTTDSSCETSISSVEGPASGSSSMAAFDGMLREKRNSPSDFAARASEDEIKSLSSISGLVDYLSSHPSATLEVFVDVRSCDLVYVAETTLPETVRSQPHFWAYRTLKSGESGLDGWCSVAAVLPMWRYCKGYLNVMFCVSDAHDRLNKSGYMDRLSNCCFPSFLSSEYKRICGKAFERLNVTMKLGVPKNESLALGVGTSAIKEDGTVAREMKFRVNGKTEITLLKLFEKAVDGTKNEKQSDEKNSSASSSISDLTPPSSSSVSPAVCPSTESVAALLSRHATQLQEFLTAQSSTHGRCASYAVALQEMERGAKISHWIWYIFPSFLCTRKTKMPHLQFQTFEAAEAFILEPTLLQRAVAITQHLSRHLNAGLAVEVLMGAQAKYDVPKLHEFLSFAALIAQKYSVLPSQSAQLGQLQLLDVCLSALKGMKVSLYPEVVKLVTESADMYLQDALKEIQKRGF